MKKKYLVTIFGMKQSDGTFQYRNSIFLAGNTGLGLVGGRQFSAEFEMIQILNHVLPGGGDVGNIDLVQNQGGWSIELELTDSEAALLGWHYVDRGQIQSSNPETILHRLCAIYLNVEVGS